jgi:type II secretory pathway component PulF
MVSAGVPLVGALSLLKDQTQSKKFKEQLNGVVKDVESGLSLADSLAKPDYILANLRKHGESRRNRRYFRRYSKKLATQQEKDAS